MTRAINRLLAVAATALVVLTPMLAPAPAGAAEALKIEGKKTLYQRVMTRVGVKLYESAATNSRVVADNIAPFTIYYVYGRRDGWISVGTALKGDPVGWLAPETAIDWNQTIVVAFNNPAEYQRERTLLFRSRVGMESLLKRSDIAPETKRLRADAAAGRSGAQSPVISIEPEIHVDINKSFYIFPILQAERQILPGNIKGRYLEVASVRRLEDRKAKTEEDARRNFRTGIVFVVDTTTSMGPYIERTRAAIERIKTQIGNSEVAANVRFGLVGFRQSEALVPNIEYAHKTFLKLDEQSTAERFTQEIAKMKASKIPTPGFDEDSVGGLVEAIQGADWRPFNARFVVLITDAGPRSPETGHVRSPMLPDQVNTFLLEQSIRPLVLHLKTPEGKSDHAYAERAYTALARQTDGSTYFPIDNADMARFGSKLDGIANLIVTLAKESFRGPVAAPADNDVTEQARLRRAWRAMQLSYLGREQGAQAPELFKAWMTDRSLDDSGVEALEVRVILTKNQLATLRDVARSIVERAERGLQSFDMQSFFTQLREAVALMARDPNRLARADFQTLGDALGEYLVDLPYDSPVASITEADWNSRSARATRALLETLKSKIELYERIYNTPAKWVPLHPGAPDGEWVTTIPLRDLP